MSEQKVAPGYNDNQSWGDLEPLKLPPLLAEPPRAEPTGRLDDMPELFVVCVEMWSKFPEHYVHRLRAMVNRHLWTDYKFVVITDQPNRYNGIGSGIWAVEPTRSLPGWYSKINLFDPDTFPAGSRVIYFDLDVVISGPLNPLAACEEPFIMIREFNAKPLSGHNSSVMSWQVPYTSEIFTKFEDDWVRRSWGDQECIWAIMGNERIWDWPDEWVKSYKYHGRGRPHPPAPITVFHGDPKQDAVADSWVVEEWR